MSKLVVLNLGKGDLKLGFPNVTAQLCDSTLDKNSIPIQFTGSLPPALQLVELYRRWQMLYKLLYEGLYPNLSWRHSWRVDDDIEIDDEDVTNISSIDFQNLCEDFQIKINIWLKSESFRNIDQKLRTKLATHDEIRVILETESDVARRIPWHLWDFFEDYQSSVFALSAPEVDSVKSFDKYTKNTIRILAILGDSEGINLQKDRELLEKLPGASTVFLVEPQRRELDRYLWDKQGWDILFFAGHSVSYDDAEKGRIYINKDDSLTISQLKNSLKAAIARGLRLAIFNSCDGLGLASELASLHIPQMIVMREGVPDWVAQEYLKYFLEVFSTGESFYLAVREAGERLQGLEGDFPCASWLPVIYQNPAAIPLTWRTKIKSSPRKLPNKSNIATILKASILATTLVLTARSLGFLQSWELRAFDSLMQLRPAEEPDKRILLITVTDADVQAQPAHERKAASLSDKTLARIIEKIERFQPRVIGLDIYRENPVQPDYPALAAIMKNSDRFVAICKVSEDENPGVPPPPEVTVERQGFSDVVSDPDGVIRRQLLAMAPGESRCNTDISFSLRLATRYLADLGFTSQQTPDNNWKLGKVIFPSVEANSGGYYHIDDRGYQVLLNYRSGLLAIKKVTVGEFLSNQFNADLIKDRIVIIGTIAESFHDYWPTPYSSKKIPYERMPGEIIQAHMVSQILSAVLDNRPLLWVLPKWSEFLWVFSWSVVGGLIAWCFPKKLHLVIAISAGYSVLSVTCLGLLMRGAWIPLVPSAIALIGSSAIVVFLLDKNENTYHKTIYSTT